MSGEDTDVTFWDTCDISAYQGQCVYIYAWDAASSSWGKTYLDNITIKIGLVDRLLMLGRLGWLDWLGWLD